MCAVSQRDICTSLFYVAWCQWKGGGGVFHKALNKANSSCDYYSPFLIKIPLSWVTANGLNLITVTEKSTSRHHKTVFSKKAFLLMNIRSCQAGAIEFSPKWVKFHLMSFYGTVVETRPVACSQKGNDCHIQNETVNSNLLSDHSHGCLVSVNKA